jgi:hypothetical protein
MTLKMLAMMFWTKSWILLEGGSEWRGPVEDANTLSDDDAANQDIMRGRLFVALRRFIRALPRLVYETPEHAA